MGPGDAKCNKERGRKRSESQKGQDKKEREKKE